MTDLLARWAELWGAGMRDVWAHYTAAQDTILAEGRALVGQTPAEVVYADDRLRAALSPAGRATAPIPVLCVPR